MAHLKKFGALLLALVLVLSLSAPAFADPAEFVRDGETGGFKEVDVDTPNVDNKSINILKEITAYNPDEAYVFGPEITYTYAIAAASGSELKKVTDETADHASGVSTVFDPILAGITTGVTMTGTGTNIIEWTNSDILDASADGTANYKKLTIDFSNVVFTAPGVYRYKITETAASYTTSGVTQGSDTSHTRYLDVYVRRSDSSTSPHVLYTDGSTAAQWIVYGYVCLANGTTDVDENTVKTNGFVDSNATAGTSTADEYKTYNLTVTKDLVNDNSMIDHQFPFAVAFDPNGVTGNFQLIAEKDTSSKSTLTTSTVASGANTVNKASNITGAAATSTDILKVGNSGALSAFANAGAPKIADGSTTTGTTVGLIKYIGIPYDVIPSVTETNDITGTTYTATVKEDVTTVAGTTLAEPASNPVTSTSGTMAANNKSASIDNTETATRTAASATANSSDVNVAVQFTNTLAIISPTGVAFRVAPYALMLAAGIVLFALSRKRKAAEEA